jgi:tetratricopeptide (TPR) repeat protein
MSLWQTLKKDQVAEARRLFERAMALDPTFGGGFIGYAATYLPDTRLGFAQRDPEKALQAARRAVELDGEDAWAHWALGLVYLVDKSLDAAISEFEYVIQLNPSFADAYAMLGSALSGTGRAKEAIAPIKQSMRLSPHHSMIGPTHSRLARVYLNLHEYEESVKWARLGLRHQNAGWPLPATLASALGHLGRSEEARQALGEMERLRPGTTIDFVRAHLPITDPDYMEHLLDGLRKAGLPE